MDAFAYILLSIILTIILFFALHNSRFSNKFPFNRLFLMISSLLFPNLNLMFHDKLAEILERSKCTIHVGQFSWFTATKILITSHPANVRHIMGTNFSNYPKGLKWKEKIDVLGDTILMADFKEWEHERKLYGAFTRHKKLHHVMTNNLCRIIDTGLIPVLERICNGGLVVDLQDLFRKHLLDIAWMMVMGYNPNTLRNEYEKDEFSKALEDVCEVAFSRCLVPENFWKLQRCLGIGKEKKLKDAWKTIDRFFAKCMSEKDKESTQSGTISEEDPKSFNFQSFYYSPGHDNVRKELRDNVISLVFATQDTTSSVLSWFFWIISKHPSVEAKIREEINQISLQTKEGSKIVSIQPEELNKLVYLHAALCETLRLFPPGPILSRTAIQPDTLPTGHRVDRDTNILIAVHAMGRMTSVWGEDCNEFKPERWITERGQIKHVPNYQFIAFSAGPRVCLGKELAFTTMKATAATIIHNYSIHIVKDQVVKPSNSVVFHMKHGLMARINNRCI